MPSMRLATATWFAREMATYLRTTNPNFDSARFLEAATEWKKT